MNYNEQLSKFVDEYTQLVKKYRCFIALLDQMATRLVVVSVDEALDNTFASKELTDRETNFWIDQLKYSVKQNLEGGL